MRTLTCRRFSPSTNSVSGNSQWSEHLVTRCKLSSSFRSNDLVSLLLSASVSRSVNTKFLRTVFISSSSSYKKDKVYLKMTDKRCTMCYPVLETRGALVLTQKWETRDYLSPSTNGKSTSILAKSRSNSNLFCSSASVNFFFPVVWAPFLFWFLLNS